MSMFESELKNETEFSNGFIMKLRLKLNIPKSTGVGCNQHVTIMES